MSRQTRLTVGSLFSGCGGFDLGFDQAGFETRWQVEIEPDCVAVLTRHWPTVRRYRDVNAVVYGRHQNRQAHGLMLEPVDVVIGGFPCQDVSVAGKRQGLAGSRSGLFFAFMRALRLLKPRWVVIENVPGLLSSHGGRDFHTVLSEVADCGFRRAYRILDSQYFGVPQRRRRVFVVGGARAERCSPYAVLFESAGSPRDSQTRDSARPRVAASLRGRSSRAGVNEPGRGGEDDSNLVTFGWNKSPSQTMRVDGQATGPLQAAHSSEPAIAYALRRDPGGTGQGHNTTYIAATLNSGGNDGGFRTEPGEHLIATGINGSGLRGRQPGSAASFVLGESQSHALTASHTRSGRYDPNGETFAVAPTGVRRLTPLECERLQGFPDGWTCLCGNGHKGSAFCACPDTPRYKMLGNAVTVPVAAWIARRLKRSADEGQGDA